MKNCPKCGTPVDDNASYCTTCGASLVYQVNNSGTQMSSSGTQEKVLYNMSYSLPLKVIGIILLILAIAGIITGFILLPTAHHYSHYYYGDHSWWVHSTVWVIILSAFLPAVVLGVVGVILLKIHRELVITDCRVYVVNNYKVVKRINIPVDSITVWGARWGRIFVGNSAGKIVAFVNKKDRNAICSILENLLIERQNSMSPESSDVY